MRGKAYSTRLAVTPASLSQVLEALGEELDPPEDQQAKLPLIADAANILAGTLATFKLPMEGIAVLLGVDAILDMARTSINVLGNCIASAVVARWEGYKL